MNRRLTPEESERAMGVLRFMWLVSGLTFAAVGGSALATGNLLGAAVSVVMITLALAFRAWMR